MSEPQYPNAQLALEYRPEVQALMDSAKQQSDTIQHQFLSYLDSHPRAPIAELKAYLDELAIEPARFENPAFEDGYQKIKQLGPQALAEFDAAYEMLGESMDIDHTVKKLTTKFGQTVRKRESREKRPAENPDTILQRLRAKVCINRDADLMEYAGISRVNGTSGYEYCIPRYSLTRYPDLKAALLEYTRREHPELYGTDVSTPVEPLQAEKRPLKRPEINIFTALGNFADFSGRATRAEYWLFMLLMLIVNFGGGVLLGLSGASDDALNGFTLVSSLIFIIPNLSVSVRRIHDLGRSGWWILLMFVPLVNIGLIIWFMFDGEKQANEYGPDPKAYYRAREASILGA